MRLRAASIGDGRRERDMTELREIASGLRFPEGPVALPGGDVLVCEIAAGRITRIAPDGARTVAAETGGGPNGAALGPDGRLWVCNNGGMEWFDRDGKLFPIGCARDYEGGSIQRINLETSAVETVWRDCEGEPLKGPNDLVFDRTGGLWFTDNGKEARALSGRDRPLLRAGGRRTGSRGGLAAPRAERRRPLAGGGPRLCGGDRDRAPHRLRPGGAGRHRGFQWQARARPSGTLPPRRAGPAILRLARGRFRRPASASPPSTMAASPSSPRTTA